MTEPITSAELKEILRLRRLAVVEQMQILKSYARVGAMFGMSRQRVWAICNPEKVEQMAENRRKHRQAAALAAAKAEAE